MLDGRRWFASVLVDVQMRGPCGGLVCSCRRASVRVVFPSCSRFPTRARGSASSAQRAAVMPPPHLDDSTIRAHVMRRRRCAELPSMCARSWFPVGLFWALGPPAVAPSDACRSDGTTAGSCIYCREVSDGGEQRSEVGQHERQAGVDRGDHAVRRSPTGCLRRRRCGDRETGLETARRLQVPCAARRVESRPRPNLQQPVRTVTERAERRRTRRLALCRSQSCQ